MSIVVGVRFKSVGKIYYFDPSSLSLERGDRVIVETSRGIELGELVLPARQVDTLTSPLKPVLRKATAHDLAISERLKKEEKEALLICQEKIENHRLEMKLIDVEYSFDRSKLTFYFTADGRVDFRELVKDLASVFHTRIELRQIGVRDEAKALGGLGPCGRSICCATFLGDFVPVSIKMAKEQNLSLNPAKISGICGRLLCCLKYESDDYSSKNTGYPRKNSLVETPLGEAKVVSVRAKKGTLRVRLLESGKEQEFPLEEVDLLEKN
ncbi:MAG: stage 0 sporulation family protein [Firmicutes bacterium]|jgi:cell fate regulator YaaT (PSP1 superfamily)|nr:stage 0 sporulation family protein [Bacillota bacterium]